MQQHFGELYPKLADVAQPGAPFSNILEVGVARGLIDTGGQPGDLWVAERLRRHSKPEGLVEYHHGDIWVRVSEQRTPDGSTVVVYTDISELKQRQEELEEAMQQAEAANRAKSAFLANMSHELRTPLNAIIGLSEMMVTNVARFGTEKAVDPLRRVHRAGRHLLELINQVLDLSKIEAGKLELNLEMVNIPRLVDEVVGTARSLAEQNKNRLKVECPDDIGPLVVDPLRCGRFTQSFKQCLQVHERRRSFVAWATAPVGRRAVVRFRGRRFLHRHDARTDEQTVRGVCASRSNNGAPIRRNRLGAWRSRAGSAP